MMREGLRTLISRERDLIVCGEAETAGQALDAIANLKPDIVLADITLPGPQWASGGDCDGELREVRSSQWAHDCR